METMTPVQKGMVERKSYRLERFKIAFATTSTFEVLNSQFPIMEIFEMNNEKFAISTVQQAYEDWLIELRPTKRSNFIKDIDKLLSGDYVLVPKQPDASMERAGMEAGAGFSACRVFKAMCAAAQGASK